MKITNHNMEQWVVEYWAIVKVAKCFWKIWWIVLRNAKMFMERIKHCWPPKRMSGLFKMNSMKTNWFYLRNKGSVYLIELIIFDIALQNTAIMHQLGDSVVAWLENNIIGIQKHRVWEFDNRSSNHILLGFCFPTSDWPWERTFFNATIWFVHSNVITFAIDAYQNWFFSHVVYTDHGKVRALIRAALNERAMERYILIWLSDANGLSSYFESWALIRDTEASNLLPSIAAGRF